MNGLIFTVLLLLSLVLLLLLTVLLYPMQIRIDSVREEYYIKLKGLLTIWLDTSSETPVFILRVPFYKRVLNPFESRTARKKKKTHRPMNEKPEEKKKPRITFHKLLALAGTFHVDKLRISMDTGDYARNALLIPLVQVFRNHGRDIQINFNGEVTVELDLSNNLWRLGRTFLFYK